MFICTIHLFSDMSVHELNICEQVDRIIQPIHDVYKCSVKTFLTTIRFNDTGEKPKRVNMLLKMHPQGDLPSSMEGWRMFLDYMMMSATGEFRKKYIIYFMDKVKIRMSWKRNSYYWKAETEYIDPDNMYFYLPNARRNIENIVNRKDFNIADMIIQIIVLKYQE